MPFQQPPKWALNFLRWYCRKDYLDEIEGDLFELFYNRSKHSGQKANLFFVWNVLRTFRPINFKKTQLINNWTMNLFKNYTKIYFRRFRKETVHYLVNILGLGLGFTILFFILMFVYDEQSIDSYHSKKDRIFQVVNIFSDEDGTYKYVSTPGPLADALKADFPSIEEVAHLTYTGSQVMVKGEKRLAERAWAVGTASIFKILDFEIISGSPFKTFSGQAGVVITEELAEKLFNTRDVVGEVLDDSRFGPAEVLAVMKEMPQNSSYRFNTIYVANYDQWPEDWQQYIKEQWRGRFAQTWVLLKEGNKPNDILDIKEQFLNKYVPEDFRENIDFDLQNIADIHLNSTGIERGGMSPRLFTPHSNKQFVSMILLLGFLVLFIAALNYINLSSVQALKRTLEASMRKINGAGNRHLVGQLFFETFLTVIISYLLALILVMLLFSYFLQIANKNFQISLLFTEDFIVYHLASVMIIWIISALLPALYYAKLKRSLLVLKNAFSGKGDSLRKILVGIQYALSIFLIIGSIVIYRQLNYLQGKDLGFDRSNLIVLDINSGAARSSFKNIINEIKQNSNVINATTSSRVPGEWKNIPTANVAIDLANGPLEVSHYAIDQHWLDTYNMNVVAGKNFTGSDHTDSLNILVNEELVRVLEIQNPIGSSLWVGSQQDTVKMRIAGVVENFHFESLYEPIKPVLMTSWNNHIRSIDYFTIRYANNPKETIDHIEVINATFDPETPAEINFLDEQWERFYKAEESRGKLILIASILSIIISAFGLFGLINFTVERKTKEIGIRKVMGASVGNIIRLVLKDYLFLLIISLIISAPIALWLFSDWLDDFAYRINIGIDLFLIAFTLVLIISFTTVLSRIFKIAKSSPVQSMRYE